MTAQLPPAERRAMQRALALAENSGVNRGPNPAVGCVLLDPDGNVLAEGWHRGPGTAHAEVAALAAAGEAARGATAVVSLEPCSHHGRTPPCTSALVAAGVTRVVFGQADPNPDAAGGAGVLRAAGVAVVGPVAADEAWEVNRDWNLAQRLRRPVVLWKVAASLDGRITAADGGSKWITSPESREQVHQLRAAADAVVTGTGTALADRPRLTARPRGVTPDAQPLRVVMGLSELPSDHPLIDAVHLRTRDPVEALRRLWELDVRRVMLECGPRLAGAFVEADLVDRIAWFGAPMLLGDRGLPVMAGGPANLPAARRWRTVALVQCGPDLRIDLEREET